MPFYKENTSIRLVVKMEKWEYRITTLFGENVQETRKILTVGEKKDGN